MPLPCTGQSYAHDIQLSTLEFQTVSQNSTSGLNSFGEIFITAISHFSFGNRLITNHASVPHKQCFNVILPTGANLRYIFS